jgi:endonuclease G
MKQLLLFARKLTAAFSFSKRKLSTPLPIENYFHNGKPIVIPGTTALCNSFYVVLFDEKMCAAILSAAITHQHKDPVGRTDDFRHDPRLKRSPTLNDYEGSGYDRGHLTAAADATTEEEMHDTFLLSNMTPQSSELNRGAWKELEAYVRDLDTTFALTGACYEDVPKTIGKNKIPVPAWYWKVAFLTDGTIEAFIADNVDTAEVHDISIEDLEKKIGFKLT